MCAKHSDIKQQDVDIVMRILETSKISSEQEEQRSSLLITKSHYAMTYVTGTFVFLNALCLFLLKLKVTQSFMVLILYVVPGVWLFGSMFSAVQAQALVVVDFFPTGLDIIESVVRKNAQEKKIVTSVDILSDKIIYYSKYTDSLKKANDKKAKNLSAVYRMFTAAIFSIGLILVIAVFFK